MDIIEIALKSFEHLVKEKCSIKCITKWKH